MTMHNIFEKLKKHNQGQYRLLGFCIFLSVLLISSFSFMYLGPTVQNFLPEGGDTRKMALLLFAVTMIGCSIFTIYASTLFFRSKSREFGIFLALGESKKNLQRVLFQELFSLTASAAILGLLLGMPVSWLIWKLFETFIISTKEMSYHFGIQGFFAGAAFSILLSFLLGIMGRRFVKRSNIIDILRSSQKSEMVREIKPYIFPVGIFLLILGLALGLSFDSILVFVWKRHIPGTSFFYLFALIGIYFILLSIVSQRRFRKKKEKFYKHMVSVSLMRFHAKSTTKNMCVITLLLFACIFSAFYGLLYTDVAGIKNLENSAAFAMHYPIQEDQITTSDIYKTAQKHSIDITQFRESDAANLVISFKGRDYKDGKYITIRKKETKLALFFSDSMYKKLTGRTVATTPGSYHTITPTDYKENIWDYRDGLYAVKNPDHNDSKTLSYAGSLEYDALYHMSDPYAYVISDADYAELTHAISDTYLEHLVLFNVSKLADSYTFAKDLLEQYTLRASALSDHMGLYDIWEEKQAHLQQKDYMYSGTIGMDPENALLLSDWKYAPNFMIVAAQDFLQQISIYVMLCLYIFIITLSAVAVMTYVRSISIAETNKSVFLNLTRLGASSSYQNQVLKTQLSKIFQYPGILGCGLGILFSLGMSFFNDQRFTSGEIHTLLILSGIACFILIFLYFVYQRSLKKAQRILNLK